MRYELLINGESVAESELVTHLARDLAILIEEEQIPYVDGELSFNTITIRPVPPVTPVTPVENGRRWEVRFDVSGTAKVIVRADDREEAEELAEALDYMELEETDFSWNIDSTKELK